MFDLEFIVTAEDIMSSRFVHYLVNLVNKGKKNTKNFQVWQTSKIFHNDLSKTFIFICISNNFDLC